MESVSRHEDRLRALLDATVALTSELSLESLLQKLADSAAALTGARYSALGVLDETGAALEQFVTSGIDAESHAAIGPLPRGRGILGVLIREARPPGRPPGGGGTLGVCTRGPRPRRLPALSRDPRSVAFPPTPPPMRSFLG